MQITFKINAASEAVMAPASIKALREMGDVVALDWVQDVIREAQNLYEELHDVVFAGVASTVPPCVNETPF